MKYQKIRGKARVERLDFSPRRPLTFAAKRNTLKISERWIIMGE